MENTAMRERQVKALLRRSVASLCATFGLAWAWRQLAPRDAIRILAYHGIEDAPENHFAVATSLFDQHMRYLSEHFEVIDLDELARLLAERRSPGRPVVVVTFDDGYRDFLTHAVPILQKYRIPAACFVIAAKLDGHDPRFMNVADIGEALASGLVTIGCHSMTHVSIRQVAREQRLIETRDAKARLEAALQRPVRDFCYPYGTRNDFDAECARVIRDSGFRLALTSVNGLNTVRTNPFALRRTKIEAGDDIRTFQRILHGALDIWYLVDTLLFFLQRRRRVRFR
jgi:peptidoglycan/xylan/chitin deacetylase (PgdA/CDA1 family)